jgi:hypothetical protein
MQIELYLDVWLQIPNRSVLLINIRKYLFVELPKGYVKAIEKSTSPVVSLREVFEPCT